MKATVSREILKKAILAPSADNLQPWKFVEGDGFLDIWIDRNQSKSFCDEALLMPYVSVGALIENMRVAASKENMTLDLSYFPDPDNTYFVSRVWFKPRELDSSEHYRVLDKRCTNRNFYSRKKKIPQEVLSKLSFQVPEDSGFRLHIIEKEQENYKALSELIGDADQIRFEAKRLHQELFNIMRFSSSEAEQTADGLDLRTLEAGAMGGVSFRLMSDWNRQTILNKIGLSVMLNRYALEQMKSSSACALLVAPTQTKESYVRGGEFMQKVWHEATLDGLAVQPMEALPIFIINLQQNQGRDFSASQIEKLENLKERFFKIFNINDEHGLILLFRMGYAKDPSARSLRRPIESFIEGT